MFVKSAKVSRCSRQKLLKLEKCRLANSSENRRHTTTQFLAVRETHRLGFTQLKFWNKEFWNCDTIFRKRTILTSSFKIRRAMATVDYKSYTFLAFDWENIFCKIFFTLNSAISNKQSYENCQNISIASQSTLPRVWRKANRVQYA